MIAKLYGRSQYKRVKDPLVPVREAIGFKPRRIEFQILPDLAPDAVPPRRYRRLYNVYAVYSQFGSVSGGTLLHSCTP